MEAVTRSYNGIKCEPGAAPSTRTSESSRSTMEDSAVKESSNVGQSCGSKGTSPTDLMTEQLEATISANIKKRIDAMVAEVNKFNDLEKLLLYLKMPTGISGFDCGALKSTSPSLTVTRVEQTQALNWIRSHLEEFSDTSLPKHEVYEDYRMHCETASRRFLSPADFGKIMKNVFPRVKARRLGTRGNAKYCYSGLRKTCEVNPPQLPSMESPRKIGPNDLPHSSCSCKCSPETRQAELAHTMVICEWAEKIFATRFQGTEELAQHLASNRLVSSSLASFTVLSGACAGSSGSSGSKEVATGAGPRPSSLGGRLQQETALALAKLPITPEERRKETQHQLQKKIQQRQLSRMKEEQTRLAGSGGGERQPGMTAKAGKGGGQALRPSSSWPASSDDPATKLTCRCQSMPNEVAMRARTESATGSGKREQDPASALGERHCNGRQPEQPATSAHPLQTNNNSNNNSNQVSAVAVVTAAVSSAAPVKESPNNKRRFTPIQPKTPVRESAAKIPLAVGSLPSRPVVLVPNGALLGSKGSKLQSLPSGFQLLLPGPASGTAGQGQQPVATIPVQSIPGSKLVAPAASKAAPGSTAVAASSPATSRGQSIMVLSPGPVLQGSTVPSGLLVMNQSPSAGLAGGFVNGGSVSSTAVLTAGQESAKMQQQQPANHRHMLQLHSDAGVASSPQGVTSIARGAQSDTVPSVASSPLLLSPPPVQHLVPPACPSSSTVLLKSALATNSPVPSSNSASSKPTVTLPQSPLTSVTFSTLPMQKQISQALAGNSSSVSGLGGEASVVVSADGRLVANPITTDGVQLPFSMAKSASALLAILSDTAIKEQCLDEGRGVTRKAPARTCQPQLPLPLGGTTQGHHQPLPLTINGAMAMAQPQSAQHSLSTSGGSKVCDSQQQPTLAPFSLVEKNGKPHLDIQASGNNTSLISFLTAPVLDASGLKATDPGQGQEAIQLTTSAGQTLPIYGFPMAAGSQSLSLAAQGVQLPIPLDVGSKRLALSSAPAQYVQQRTVLSQISEVAPEAVDLSLLVKQETSPGATVSQGVSIVGALGARSSSVGGAPQQPSTDVQGRQNVTPSFNSHSNTATPIPVSLESVPLSPNDSSKVYFTFVPIQQTADQTGTSVTSPSLIKPMQKPKPTFGTAQGSFATPNRKRRSSGSTRRPPINSCLPPVAVTRQMTPSPSPGGSRCSTPASPSLSSAQQQSDAASMPPPSPAVVHLSDLSLSQLSRALAKHDQSSQVLGQSSWGVSAAGSRKRNPSGPATLMQPSKQQQHSLDAASFLPEDLTELNIRSFDSSLDFGTAQQQQYQRSHSVPLPAYQPVVLSQDRFLSNFPPQASANTSAAAEQRGVTINNRTFGAKRNLTQTLQEIQVTDEDFNPPEDDFLDEGGEASFQDLLGADLRPPGHQSRGSSWPADPALGGMQPECPADLGVDLRDAEPELGLGQGLGDNSNSTASTLNEDLPGMDDMESNPVFQDFALPSWQQIGSNGNLATLECGM